ncbi:MAG: extracellular solute-binding protein [Propionibacteriaceae bacterium]|nr:extracellular solute-binding protein [Propionibacteriaceae bacterium]
MKTYIKGLAVVGALSLAVSFAACSPANNDDPGDSGKLNLTVVGLLPGSTEEAYARLAEQVADFEKSNPDIKVTTVDYEWKATTFAADLAGGTLPDVFEIPFTDGKTLIANNQIANVNDLLAEFPYKGAFNEGVLQYGKGSDGQVYAIPAKSIYGVGLHYNRDLFTQAGLDPDQPPATWDEVRTAAKAISDATGVAGFCQMAQSNTGGWQITVDTYARGGRMETVDADGKATATLDNDATKASLEFLKELRWTDNSMGANFTYDWGSINQAFAAGQCGMYTSGQDVYVNLVDANGMSPDIYGLAMVPLEGADSGVLGGGTLAAISVNADDATKAAAVKWISYFYLGRYVDQAGAVAYTEIAVANGTPVGVPELPIFSDAALKDYQTWIEPYINVPVDQMTPFTSQIGSAKLVNEPPVSTQDVYAALDPVVQAVLTDQNADIDALLAEANVAAQREIDRAQS